MITEKEAEQILAIFKQAFLELLDNEERRTVITKIISIGIYSAVCQIFIQVIKTVVDYEKPADDQDLEGLDDLSDIIVTDPGIETETKGEDHVDENIENTAEEQPESAGQTAPPD